MANKYRRTWRYYEIIKVLARQGLLSLSDKISHPQRVRRVFEDLGPTFVKLGQLLSTRPDLVPRPYVAELSKLQDDVEEIGEAEIRSQIFKAMGRFPEEIFLDFNFRPLASASIGQVHEAVLAGGEKVVVKVQRPHLLQLVEGDIRILKRFSGLLQKHTVIGKVCDVQEIIEVFERQIHRELDYLTEAVNTEAFFREFAKDDQVVVPRPFSEYTTREILTMEYVAGIRVEEFETHEYPPEARRRYAANMLTAVFRPLFVRGLFHGDPHPGNILFQDEFRIVLIDFGIVGRFDQKHRRLVAELMVALAERDIPAVMNIILETGHPTRRIHHQHFFEDVSEIVEKANGVTSGGVQLGELIYGMITISIDHGIRMPENLFILGKTVMICENMARRIDPDLDIAEIIRPLAVEYLRQALRPEVFSGSMYKQVSAMTEGLASLPGNICQAVRNLANNDTKITFYHRNLNWLYEMLDISSTRIAFGLILAAIIVGSALIMHAGRGPALWGYPVLGTVGYVFSTVLGVMVLISMVFSGRLR